MGVLDRASWMGALLALGVLVVPGPGGAAPTPFSPLGREWLERQAQPAVPLSPLPGLVVASPGDSPGAAPGAQVLGWLPYWQVDGTVLHLDRLTVLAYMGAGLAGDGTLGDSHHWGTPAFQPTLDAAHAAGVRVVLTVTCFDGDAAHQLLSTSSARWKAIGAVLARVRAADGDGVNLDFEGLHAADRGAFVSFVSQLKDALDQDLGGASHLSVATPAVDWSDAYDYAGLAASADLLAIMGYDYHWRGGSPGPVSPLVPSARWGAWALSSTVDDYAKALGGVLDKVVLGVPLYGYDWPVASNVVPATSTGKASAVFYAACQSAGTAAGWQWDDPSQVPWYAHDDGGPRQCWCENGKSLAAKFALARDRKLAGVAFWALGYEGTGPEVWDLLAEAFPPPVPDPDAGPEAVPDAPVAAEVEMPDAAGFLDGGGDAEPDAGGDAEPDAGGGGDPAPADGAGDAVPDGVPEAWGDAPGGDGNLGPDIGPGADPGGNADAATPADPGPGRGSPSGCAAGAPGSPAGVVILLALFALVAVRVAGRLPGNRHRAARRAR